MLVVSGRTKLLCTVGVQEQVPPWMYGRGGGWLTAEYSMLPGSTHPRKTREGRTGRGSDGRSLEIQRLVGRCLRSALDLSALPEVTLWVDCDVLSADGGTRTAAVNGASVALYDALLHMEEKKALPRWPMNGPVAAISVGLVNGRPLVDLDYQEDSSADVDLSVVCTADGRLADGAFWQGPGHADDQRRTNRRVIRCQLRSETVLAPRESLVRREHDQRVAKLAGFL